jgi:hypothetical protein
MLLAVKESECAKSDQGSLLFRKNCMIKVNRFTIHDAIHVGVDWLRMRPSIAFCKKHWFFDVGEVNLLLIDFSKQPKQQDKGHFVVA